MYQRNIKAYKAASLEAELSVADPHRVIQLLMQGFLERLAKAKGAIERKDYEQKSMLISSATAILNGLQDSLDMELGGITNDLYGLYAYMKDRLLDASVNMDIAAIDEVIGLMLPIKSAWDQVPEEEKQKAYAMRRERGELS
ncbi:MULTISPECIES: flagellar export chaperone FliS [Aeromonas]|uniref:Flagellar secretion chaperone FliS n=3 Tax=Gammaproteobacteria TaxID=1236 RepID=A0AAF0GCN7_AERCA|nr:flagellar export chaperone FliS [Aeromonas caviae]BEE17194.1 flagellar protein FliS [Aeromonas enteropelogenes]MBL0558300.1 flagellar export chaperone FliS [Aeromonas caviae]MBL0582822.1 flagellar export chaperone FliS [Aeromonas caviae]MDX7676178.1 flagellar export chaperone FliS [Aeromonas caviae]MDX7721599.1 flagellar export chaperone FliS [Aeromonas caviae]